MKIKLSNNLIINTKDIKSLRDKPMRLYVSFGKEIKVDYSIEHLDGTFTEINKKEYKLLKGMLGNETKM